MAKPLCPVRSEMAWCRWTFIDHEIKPVIDIRNCWQDGETSKVVEGQLNVIYTFDGEVSCVCPRTGTELGMSYGGFERDRNALKYRCPARTLGIECQGMEQCPGGTAVRIPLREDRRVFTPVAGSSYLWKEDYDKRSAVERVNSRLAGSFGFDDPFIRGPAKMQLRCTMALSIMLAMALGRIEGGQREHLRSLTKKRLSPPHSSRTGTAPGVARPVPLTRTRRSSCPRTYRARSHPYRRCTVPNELSRTVVQGSVHAVRSSFGPGGLPEIPYSAISSAGPQEVVLRE